MCFRLDFLREECYNYYVICNTRVFSAGDFGQVAFREM